MKYNKKNQPFTILGRFRIYEAEAKGEVEYCRIQFHNTGYVANIRAGLVKENDFEDESVVIEESIIEENESSIEMKVSKTDEDVKVESTVTITPEEINIDATEVSVESVPVVQDVEITDNHSEPVIIVEPTVIETPEVKITAIDPDGEEFSVEDLEAFVAEHDLDMEAVEACLEGKQKTHKKWRFTR